MKEEKTEEENKEEKPVEDTGDKRNTPIKKIKYIIIVILILSIGVSICEWSGLWLYLVWYKYDFADRPCKWLMIKLPLFVVGRGLLKHSKGIWILGYWRGKRDGGKYLLHNLDRGDNKLRARILGDSATLEYICRGIESHEIRKELLPVLKKLLQTDSKGVIWGTAENLAEFLCYDAEEIYYQNENIPPEYLQELIPLLIYHIEKNVYPDNMIYHLVRAIGAYRSYGEEALPCLREVVKNTGLSSRVKKEAITAISKIGGETAINILRELEIYLVNEKELYDFVRPISSSAQEKTGTSHWSFGELYENK